MAMQNKLKILVVGYGNVGRGVYHAIKKNLDVTIVGIITRRPEQIKKEVTGVYVSDINKEKEWCNKKIDVAILCGGSKKDLLNQGPYFAKFFNTVDSFDTHAKIPEYFAIMDRIAKKNGHVSVISVGWDPGTFSLERALADAFFPGVQHYTFWGPGISQGHSDAVRQINGVKDARQYTIPIKKAMERARTEKNLNLTTAEKHKRLVYVVSEEGADKERIESEIKTMPNYFKGYHTEVKFISDEEMRKNHSKYPHGGFVLARGKTGDMKDGNKALIEYRCEWGSNPEATGSILVAYARAAHRLNKEGEKGAFTILDIPAAYLSHHPKKELIKRFI